MSTKVIAGTAVIAVSTAVIAVCLVIAAGQGTSAGPSEAPDPIDEAPIDTQDVLPSPPEAPTDDVWREIQDLQLTLRQIQEVLDVKMLAIAELEDENEKLRDALRVRYGRERSGLPPVPMPHREFIESVLSDLGNESENGGSVRPRTTSFAGDYTIVSQWGRSPEVAAELPGNVSSLVGLAVAVAPGLNPAELEALGRELRSTYNAYDNINIQVFDNVQAAKNYADLGKSAPRSLVLSISKHKHSERDKTVRFENGRAIEVK